MWRLKRSLAWVLGVVAILAGLVALDLPVRAADHREISLADGGASPGMCCVGVTARMRQVGGDKGTMDFNTMTCVGETGDC